ncbi:MAG: class I SAM-dependent methyltransferase [Deltaproteobacteria bacterium]|nr:class I SAM-dependent methyltransferase [Deltaproteobacteria bacterium]
MEYVDLRKRLSFLKRTPFHPQWLIHGREKKLLAGIGDALEGRVLDIGCSDQRLRPYLKKGTRYIGLDYYDTAENWYQTKPQVYGDAAALPFHDSAMDSIVLLDVLEHLPGPETCLKEISRVLTPGGLLILQVPFLYPLHDEPLDYHRWTIHGLRSITRRFGFIALSKTALNWIRKKSVLSVLVLLLPFLVTAINILSWAAAGLSQPDDMMPHGYRLTLKTGDAENESAP